MAVSHIEFLVEEPSMETFLNSWLPRFLPGSCTFNIHSHQGKQALLRKLEGRLKGYASFLPTHYCIVVIVDMDQDNCKQLKDTLENACGQAGLCSRKATGSSQCQVVTRIVIEELEAWYFGDWPAVCKAFPRVSEKISERRLYRNPDAIGNTWETFERVLQRSGYFKQGLPKVQAATAIGKHINPERNRSPSFQAFWQALTETVS